LAFVVSNGSSNKITGGGTATLNGSFTTGTCDQTSGAPPSPTFADANPVTYTVTDGAIVQHYVVTVTVLPAGPGGVNGAVLWMDASQLSGLSDGDAVDTWTDLSGNDHTASHSSGSMTYATGQLNSLPAVQFRGNGQATLQEGWGSLNMDLAEIVAFDHPLSSTDENSVGAYLANKYGIATTYVSSGYGTWAGTCAGGQAADQDYNNDGVPNGIAYFMGATGVVTNPGVMGGAVTWPHSASATGVTYKVLTSANLADWTDVTGAAIDAGGFLIYTLPTGSPKLFVRLEVLVP